MRFPGILFIVALCFFQAQGQGIIQIAVDGTNILFTVEVKNSLSIVELAPYQSAGEATNATPLISVTKKGKSKIAIPRFDQKRDRIYSGFVAVENNMPVGSLRFVEEWKNLPRNADSYPRLKSKKGLQVQMVEDAVALGVKHAALNVNIAQMVSLAPATNDLAWDMDGRTFHFRVHSVERMDSQIKALCDAGANVSLILLNYESGDAAQNTVLLHPRYDKSCPEHLSAFNTATPEGLEWFKAWMEFLAARYSAKSYPHGRVVDYIVGNEVNSHWWWSNMGKVSMAEFARDYLRTVRICHTAVRKFSANARVLISLEHHWNIRYAAGDETQSFAGRAFLDYFNEIARSGGNFDWHLAFHPYPENLFNCRTWNDRTATFSNDTPRITFKNLQMLPLYLEKNELLYRGKPRRISLSEQGFHSDGTSEGELIQAAAYCYAFRKAASLETVDSFILHRHVDHSAEGGLNLGLWRRSPNSIGEPLSKKPIYEVFRLADTPQWEKAFEFALPIIKVKGWKEIESLTLPSLK